MMGSPKALIPSPSPKGRREISSVGLATYFATPSPSTTVTLRSTPGRSVEQINIRQPISVIIKDRYAARGHFEDVILRRRAGVMFEIRQGCFVRGIFKNQRRFRIGNTGGSSRGVVNRRSSHNPAL